LDLDDVLKQSLTTVSNQFLGEFSAFRMMDLSYDGGADSDVESSDADSIATLPRRSTRSALTDVSSRVPLPVTPVLNMLSSVLTPSPSPDELIIQQRGRRKAPVTFSPDVKRTPIKMPGSPSKSNIVLRSTPRKRLLLCDDPMSPEKTPRKVSRMLGRLDALNLSQVSTIDDCMRVSSLVGSLPLSTFSSYVLY
jgi:hypothetical protein